MYQGQVLGKELRTTFYHMDSLEPMVVQFPVTHSSI